MLILEDISAEVPDTNSYYWNFKQFSDDDGEKVLMYGYNTSGNILLHQATEGYDKIFFNNWAPCEFAQVVDHNNMSPLEYDKRFNTIYSICPYTTRWLNSLNLGRKYKTIFYPFCKSLIPEETEKQYDVIYHGGIHGEEHVNCLLTMKHFNYRYVTMTNHINQLTQQCLPFATNLNVSFREKIDLIARSKTSVCYNLVHVAPNHVSPIQSRPRWQENEAFNEVGRQNIMPQFKTRVHEAAISKTLNLIYRDPWNIIERYYKPESEFIYFDNAEDLRNRIKDVVENWGAYQNVVDSAYQKAMSYTTDKFVKLIRNREEWQQ